MSNPSSGKRILATTISLWKSLRSNVTMLYSYAYVQDINHASDDFRKIWKLKNHELQATHWLIRISLEIEIVVELANTVFIS